MGMRIVFLLGLCLQVLCAQADMTFKNFQLKHNKTYASNSELTLREQIFTQNLAKIEKHNQDYQQGLVSYEMGVNQFTDLTEEEFASTLKTWQLNDTMFKNGKTQDSSQFNASILPDSVDWRDYEMVTPVKNQMSCGSCWAFSATGTLEGQLAKATGNLTSLSEQQLIDCDTKRNRGCSEGTVQGALQFVIENGLTTENEYPYEGYKDICNKSHKNAVRVEDYINVFNESDLKLAVGLIGPVSVAINADLLARYKSGILDPDLCSNSVNHGVLVVGYGSNFATGKQYWIIKNSWGPAWGENGYYRMAMGRNLCGITRQACYPYGVTSFGNYSSTTIVPTPSTNIVPSSGNYLLQNSVLVVLGFVMFSFNAFAFL